MDRVDQIMKYGKAYQGRNELLKYLKGGKLTIRQAAKAKCYECEAYYQDGKQSCAISTCPLQPWNAYRVGGAQKSRVMSEEQKKATRERLKNARFASSAKLNNASSD